MNRHLTTLTLTSYNRQDQSKMKNILNWTPAQKEPPELVFNPYFYKEYATEDVNDSNALVSFEISNMSNSR